MDIDAVPNLSPAAVSLLREDGIEQLYPPQTAAVDAGVTDGDSVVASVPTASGKTLIAKLALLSALETDGMGLYIVPLRALANEKHDEFAALESLGIDVGIATGNYEGRGEWLSGKDLIVATSEKVDSLVRNDAPWIDSLSCVVADEIHLIDDPNRGPTLEVTLAKLRRVNPGLQVVALSATVANGETMAEWLDASLIESDWRPVDLRMGVHYGNAVTFDDGTQRELLVRDQERQTAAIVRSTLADDGSTLVFVNSRRNAQAAAKRLTDTVEPRLTQQERADLTTLAGTLREDSDTELSRILAECVEAGTAFHHAGLTGDQRSAIEAAFRDRQLKAVVATPTLAAGVNTPSRRVVVRDWRRYDSSVGGMAPLSVLEVHQMMGRAGRPGLDPYGEALLLARSHDDREELFDRYIYADPEPVESKLATEPALRTHVLATVASGFANSQESLEEFLSETLYATQTADRTQLERVLEDVLWYLEANEFITRTDESVQATDLGQVVSRLYLDPMSAATIIDGIAAADDPTAIGWYHVIARTPDLYELYLRSGDREHYTEVHHERSGELIGTAPSEFDETAFEEWLAALKTARLLEDWALECDEEEITERYDVGPGDIRGKVDTAEWLLGAAEELAAAVDKSAVHSIAQARRRVVHGVTPELLELVSVNGVGRKRARRLYDAGIETPAALKEADTDRVVTALGGRAGVAENILAAVGRTDLTIEGDTRPDPTPTGSDATGQSSLGDFGGDAS